MCHNATPAATQGVGGGGGGCGGTRCLQHSQPVRAHLTDGSTNVPRTRSVPFVLVSAWPSPPQEELNAIDATFLPKPFDFPDVIRTIQTLSKKN